MCGITGIFYFDNDKLVERYLLDQMTDSLRHRGPEDRGIYIDGNIGLGFRRLSIIDLSPAGHQPMCNENGTVWIVFNGEIYNYHELRLTLMHKKHKFKSRTDTEVIIHAYEEWGKECLEKLDGMFAFAIWDSKINELFLARDRFGIKPLFHFHKNGIFAFGSEIKSILPVPQVSRDIDYHALWNYFSFMQIPAPQTIYKDIRKFIPAQAMVIKPDGSSRTWQYWDIAIEEDNSKTEEEYAEALYELFEKAMRRHLNADVPVGISLSGGLDSSSIVAYTRKIQQQIKTFSVCFPNDIAYDESQYQRIVSKYFKTDHYEFQVKPDILEASKLLIRECDEPFAVSSAIPFYYIASLASEHVKVLLTGDGGDELFAGYDQRYRSSELLNKLDFLPMCTWRRANDISNKLFPKTIGMDTFGRRLRKLTTWGAQTHDDRYLSMVTIFNTEQKELMLHPDIVREVRKDYGDYYDKILKQAPHYGLNRNLYLDAKTSLSDEMLTKADRCTSMVSIEGRVPLLDKSFAEMAFRIPTKYKLNASGGKQILKKAFSPLLPSEIILRKKTGFNVPLGAWLKEFNWDIIESYREPSVIRKDSLLKMINANNLGQKDWSKHLWMIIVCNIFFVNNY